MGQTGMDITVDELRRRHMKAVEIIAGLRERVDGLEKKLIAAEMAGDALESERDGLRAQVEQWKKRYEDKVYHNE